MTTEPLKSDLSETEVSLLRRWQAGDDTVSLRSLFDDAAAYPDVSRAIRATLDAVRAAAHREGLEAVRAAIVSRLEHGLRHIPGATKSEERHYNDGQGFGLRYALERIDAALSEEPR